MELVELVEETAVVPATATLAAVRSVFPADAALREEPAGLAVCWVRETEAGIVVVSVRENADGVGVTAEVPLPLATAALASVVTARPAPRTPAPQSAVPGLVLVKNLFPGLKWQGEGDALAGYETAADGLTVSVSAFDPAGEHLELVLASPRAEVVRHLLGALC